MRAIERLVPLPMPDAEDAVRATLGAQGFGVLTENDVAATLAAKLGIERPPLKILGACKPHPWPIARSNSTRASACSCRATWCWSRPPAAPAWRPSIRTS